MNLDNLRDEVEALLESYESRCSMIWDDMVFEFAVKHNITDEEADRIIDEMR